MPNAIGADVVALDDAYAEAANRESAMLLRLGIGTLREGLRKGDLTQAHKGQMQLADAVRLTPLSDWQAVLKKIEEMGWPARGGFLATQAHSVRSTTTPIKTEPRWIARSSVTPEAFDVVENFLGDDTEACLRASQKAWDFRNTDHDPLDYYLIIQSSIERSVEIYGGLNADGFPNAKYLLEALRKGKAEFLRGHTFCARFELLLGVASVQTDLSSLILIELARQLPFVLTANNWNLWYNKGKQLLDTLIRQRHSDLRKMRRLPEVADFHTPEVIDFRSGLLNRDISRLEAFRQFYEEHPKTDTTYPDIRQQFRKIASVTDIRLLQYFLLPLFSFLIREEITLEALTK